MADNQNFSAGTKAPAACLAASTTTGSRGGLAALAPLVEQARQFAADAKAASTRRAYRSDWRQFTTWCSAHGLSSMPARPEAVATYVTYMASVGKKAATIARAVVSISQAHKMSGHESPTAAGVVRETLKGIRRSMGVAQVQKAAMLPQQLRAIVAELADDLLAVRNRALLLLGFAGGFRRSELVALDVADVEFTADGLVVVIRRSKCDQESQGRKIGIPHGSSPATCPVRSLRAWFDAAAITAGPVFRPVGRWGHVADARLGDRAVARVVQQGAEALGLDPTRYGGHSLRAGLATAAARAGRSERAIMAQTGHRSEAMVRRYIRDGRLFSENAAAGLL